MRNIQGHIVDENDFSEGFLAVRGKDGKWGYIDKYGLAIDYMYDSAAPFQGGLALVTKDGESCFIDADGDKFCDELGRISDGYIPARRYGKWGYVDHMGWEKVDFEYDIAGDFVDGFLS